jgi:hypothetical protein
MRELTMTEMDDLLEVAYREWERKRARRKMWFTWRGMLLTASSEELTPVGPWMRIETAGGETVAYCLRT